MLRGILITATLFCFAFLYSQPIQINQWRVHTPYKAATCIAENGDQLFLGTTHGMFSFDKTDNSLTTYNRNNGLSDLGIASLAFSKENNVLLIAYENTNIDLLIDGNVTNVADIKRSSITGTKRTNSVNIFGDKAYLSLAFGIVEYNLKRLEFGDTYYIGNGGAAVEVYETLVIDNAIFAATSDGVYEANVNANNLIDFNAWTLHDIAQSTPAGPCNYFGEANGTLYGSFGDSIFTYNGSSWNVEFADTAWQTVSLTEGHNEVYVSQRKNGNFTGRLVTIEPVSAPTINNISQLGFPHEVILGDDGQFYFADQFQGLVFFNGSEQGAMRPEGPATASARRLATSNNNLYVAPGGVAASWNFLFNNEGIFEMKGGFWKNIGSFNEPLLQGVIDIMVVNANPNGNRVAYGSFDDGVLEFVGGVLTKYKKGFGLQGIALDSNSVRVTGLAYDENTNLWMSNYGAPKPIVLKTNKGEWASFEPPFPMGQDFLGDLIVDENNYKWITYPRGGGVLVYDSGDDILDPGDDQYRKLSTGVGAGNLPSNIVLSVAEDKDGDIWIGTDLGVVIFRCGSSIFEGCDGDLIIVEQDNFAGHLFETEQVNTITVDGANRKWVGTNNGLWLMSEDGRETELFFNIQNSPLISNVILDVEIDGQTGEAYIATDKGIVSYKGNATEFEETKDVVSVIPNPVRPGYDGDISIRGLAENAYFKVTDISGTLVHEGRAFGSQAIWNGRDYNNRKANTGVYLVFSTDEDGSFTKVAKVLFIN